MPTGAVITKLIQRIWAAENGCPLGDVEQARQQERDDVGDERHHHEADVLEHVVVELAPLGDGLHDRGEVVVGEDHLGGVLGDLGARSHRDADVGGLDRRSVVDAVPGHRDDVALLAQGLDHQHLVLGRHAADDADAVDAGQPLLLRERREVGAQDRLPLDAELPRDRLARDHVVAGHHANADVGVLGVADRFLRLGPRRVDHPDHRRQLQPRHQGQQVAGGIEVRRVDVPGAPRP